MLLLGCPYDIHTYLDVTPLLAAQGYRVITPYVRGHGTTRFLSRETFRNGQQSVLAVDAIALMDALEIDKAVVAGFDWGAPTANIVAALWLERGKGLVSVSGYLIGSQEAGKLPLPSQAELQWWYQFYSALRGGRGALSGHRRMACVLLGSRAALPAKRTTTRKRPRFRRGRSATTAPVCGSGSSVINLRPAI